jgi:hypothetical protein
VSNGSRSSSRVGRSRERRERSGGDNDVEPNEPSPSRGGVVTGLAQRYHSAMTSSTQWIQDFARRLGVEPPSAEDVATILNVAGVAAHASERTAAPVACWLAARHGLDPSQALELARSVPVDVQP